MGAALLLIDSGAYGVSKFKASVDIPLGQMANDLITKLVARTPTSAAYDGLLDSGPKERRQRDTGWELPTLFVAAPGRSDLLLADIAIPPEATPNAQPGVGKINTFNLNTNCTLRRPQAGEVVRNVRFGDTARYTNMHVFSKPELAKAVGRRIKGITRHPNNYNNAAIAKGRMGQVDVFVTDTSAPVYLVLQTFNRDILWNIHLADGATLSHVAMIGNKSGFAAPPGNYTFEGLRIEDFVDKDNLYKNEEIRPCMIAPWRKTEADWPLLQKLDDGLDASMYQRQLTTINQGYEAYNVWYTAQLGVQADHNLTTVMVAAHALVDPVPLTPLTQHPIDGRDLQIAQNDYVAFGAAQLEALHDDLLLAATGGDLSILKQAPMEVAAK